MPKNWSPQRALVLLILGLLTVLANAQSVLVPRWAANGWSQPSEHPKFSADGTKVLVWEKRNFSGTYYAWAAYNVADGKVLAHISIDGKNGILTGATLSPDGSTVYYGTDQGIYAYNLATQTQSLLPLSGVSSQNGPRYLAITKDGKTLGYILNDTFSGNDVVYLYNLVTSKVLKHFSITNTGTSNKTAALSFVASDTEVVVSGPTLYDFSGDLINSATNGSYDLAVSPDQQTIYAMLGSSYNSNIAAYRVSDLAQLWSVQALGFFDSGSVTSDGKAILFTSYASTGHWGVSGLNSADGTQLPESLSIPVAGASQAPFIASIPNSNQILVGTEVEPSSQIWKYDSSTGSGSFVGTFFEGYSVGQRISSQQSTSVLSSATYIGTTLLPALSDQEQHPNGNSIVIRNANNGQIVTSGIPSRASVSPNGQFYALVGGPNGNGVSVYGVSTGNLLDSTSLNNTNNDLTYLQWGGSQWLSMTGGNGYYNPGPFIVNFDGSNLQAFQTFSFGTNPYKLSPDGSKLAVVNNAQTLDEVSQVDIFDVASGSQIGSILAESDSGGIDSVVFSQNNRLGVHEIYVSYNGNPTEKVEYRVFDLSGSSPVLIRKFTYQTATPVQNSSGALSNNGQIVVIGHVTGSTATDPRTEG